MKTSLMFLIFMCILSVVTFGCITPVVTHQKTLTFSEAKSIIQMGMNKRWKGHHVSEVIQLRGPANQISSDTIGGKIYIWIESLESRRRVKNQPIPQTPKKTQTHGTVRWNPLSEQWEFRSQTGPVDTPPDAAEVLSQLHRQRRTETYNEYFRIMVYTRNNGTIYHCLVK